MVLVKSNLTMSELFEALADAKPRISAPLSVLGSLKVKDPLVCL